MIVTGEKTEPDTTEGKDLWDALSADIDGSYLKLRPSVSSHRDALG